MTNKIANPPAFPEVNAQKVGNIAEIACNPGMTLRDYFAAKAMQQLISDPSMDGSDEVAIYAYLYADGMLKERSKK